jgi:hypothetical protein
MPKQLRYSTALTFCLLLIAFCFLIYVSIEPIVQKAETLTIQDGSVLFWKDTFLVRPITRRTGSNLTHAAILLDGYVWEAVPPAVHKVPIADYMVEMKNLKRGSYFVMHPTTPYTDLEVRAMVKYAESQLGRPYMIRGYGKRLTRGIFCSQLIGDVLERSGRIESDGFMESPGSLYNKLKPLYR